MLALTRKKDEEIYITHEDCLIRLIIGDVKGKSVKLLIDAPGDVKILRSGIKNEKEHSNVN